MKPFVCVVFLVGLTACDRFLDADLNKSQITADKVFGNNVTATAAVTAIYNTISNSSPLSGVPHGMNALAGLSSGELYNYRQEDPDYKAFQQHDITPQNPKIKLLWNFMYYIVYQANAALEGIDRSSSLSAQTSQQLKGEALFIRAFVYFYLVNLFGDVPLVKGTDYRVNKSLSRQAIERVYALMESDLLSAQSLLSQEYVTSNRVRPNKATATALLARLYLYRQEYVKAEAQASSIIDDPSYRLAEKKDIDKIFLIDSPETIWQLMPVEPYANTTEGHNFIITSTPQSHIVTDALREHFDENDLRYTYWMNSFANTLGVFYFPFKYKQSNKEPTAAFTECSIVFRLAEIYLIRAEAHAYLGNVVGAQSDLNTLRLRAGLPATTTDDQQSLLRAVEAERWSELFTEYGHRWFDLKRTNRAVEVLDNGITDNDLLYPLPADEFVKNSSLGIQNPGY